ncbi:MAG: hypothetical protein F6K31_26025 [Symploca sp. SIO2G7]|nr:hypothetical protein [Symploca sp. SIO2G7]
MTTSIVFGIVGGFAGGLVAAWWDALGGEPVPNKDRKGENNLLMFQLPKWRWRTERRHLRRRQR